MQRGISAVQEMIVMFCMFFSFAVRGTTLFDWFITVHCCCGKRADIELFGIAVPQ